MKQKIHLDILESKIPNLYIVGVAKAGTTSLYEYLMQHYDIFGLEKLNDYYTKSYRKKEPFFWVSDLPEIKKLEYYDNIIKEWDVYMQLYSYSKDEKYRLDASTAYFYCKEASKRIRKYSPNARILISLRNPVFGVYSMYTYMKSLMNREFENITFEQALKKDSLGEKFRIIPFGLKKNNLYYKNVKAYLDAFGKENVKIIIFEEWIRNTTKTLEEICDFLNIERIQFNETKKIHNVSGIPENNFQVNFYKKLLFSNGKLKKMYRNLLSYDVRMKIHCLVRRALLEKNLHKEKIKEETKQSLMEYYREDVKKTEELIGRDLSFWYK